jgi:Transposase
MGKLIERCAGIDIGKRFLLCCVMTGAAHEEPRVETRRFDTTVPGLMRLRNWLNDEHVTDVVMESTGSYWIKENTFPSDTYPTPSGIARVPRVGECADKL